MVKKSLYTNYINEYPLILEINIKLKNKEAKPVITNKYESILNKKHKQKITLKIWATSLI